MAFDDRIRSSIETALADLRARLDEDVRAIVERVVAIALEDREQAVELARRSALDQAQADTRNEVQAAEARLQSRIDGAVAEARVREREAEMAGITRLLESVRGLDVASSLSEVLDALGQAAAREASRAAVFVLRNERVQAWKLAGFGAHDAQPKAIDVGLNDSGVIGLAAGASRPVTTRESQGVLPGSGFADLPADRMGLAVPVTVGGRVVAVVYADSVEIEGKAHSVPSGWPEVIEVLARHAGRCLEALTVQKTGAPSRFWVATGSQPGEASTMRARSTTPTDPERPPDVSA
jgi:vacuolar-type H+-ATPase subunit E/Vma4